jgi:hypothetical protein
MFWAAALSAGGGLGGDPECSEFDVANCFNPPGSACSQFYGVSTCAQISGAPEYCVAQTVACTVNGCNGDNVYIECSYGDEGGGGFPN